MAIYHFSAKTVSRAEGRSSTAAAAYRSGELIVDARTGEIHDYSRKGGVGPGEVILPGGGTLERSTLWNAVEAAHKRKDSIVAREFELAIPHELDEAQRVALISDFFRGVADQYGVAVDWNYHEGHDENLNGHVHGLMSACYCAPDGRMGKKCVELDPIHCKRAGILNPMETQRAKWETACNAALQKAGSAERVDHRTLLDQGITDRVPGVHLGPAATAILRRGEHSTLAERAKRKVDEFITHVQADAAIQAAAERDVAEIEAQLDQLLAEQADPARHAQRLRSEIAAYQVEYMEGPETRLRQASDALYNRSQRRELVEPAYNAVQQARQAQERARATVQALNAEIEDLPWYRALKRRELARDRDYAQAQLLPLKAVINEHKPMATRPITELCEQAMKVAQRELDQVQPGMDALQSELYVVEREMAELEAKRQAEVELVRQAQVQARNERRPQASRDRDDYPRPGG